MPARKRNDPAPRRRPATTPEGRQQQMINLADTLAEKQLREGSASAMVMVHYLKLGTTKEQLEVEKLRKENLLKEAQIKQMESNSHSEEMYTKALEAMRAYQGSPDE